MSALQGKSPTANRPACTITSSSSDKGIHQHRRGLAPCLTHHPSVSEERKTEKRRGAGGCARKGALPAPATPRHGMFKNQDKGVRTRKLPHLRPAWPRPVSGLCRDKGRHGKVKTIAAVLRRVPGIVCGSRVRARHEASVGPTCPDYRRSPWVQRRCRSTTG